VSSGRGKEEAINGDFDFIISNQNPNLHLFFLFFSCIECVCAQEICGYENEAEGSLDKEKNKTGMECVFNMKKQIIVVVLLI